MNFKIPTKFKLMGIEVEVRYDPKLWAETDHVGEACFRQHTIILQPTTEDKPRPQEAVEASFFHELVHWILETMGEKKIRHEERFVDLFGGLLHQALTTMEFEENNK